jgi:hypothetical protein
MLHDRDGVDRLLAHRILAKISLQIIFRESIEADASTRFFTIDTNERYADHLGKRANTGTPKLLPEYEASVGARTQML